MCQGIPRCTGLRWYDLSEPQFSNSHLFSRMHSLPLSGITGISMSSQVHCPQRIKLIC